MPTAHRIGLGLPNPFEAVDLNNDLKADLATYIDAHSATNWRIPGSRASTSLIVTAVSTGDGRFAVQYQDTGQDWPAYTSPRSTPTVSAGPGHRAALRGPLRHLGQPAGHLG